MNHTVLDIVLIIPPLIGLIRGMMRGLVGEIASLAALVGGIIIAYYTSQYVYDLLVELVDHTGVEMQVAAFVLVFIIVALVIRFLSKALTKLMNVVALGFVNHLLGAAFGMAKWLLVTLIIIYFLDKMQQNAPVFQQETLDNSVIYQEMKHYAQYLSSYIDQASGYIPQEGEVNPP